MSCRRVGGSDTGDATLNAGAGQAMQEVGVHSATDVTGFGLIGHLHQMALASGVAIRVHAKWVPLLPEAERLALQGYTTREGSLNREYVGELLQFNDECPYLCNMSPRPSTSGGLVIAVEPERVSALLEALRARQTPYAEVLGEVFGGQPGLIGWSRAIPLSPCRL